MPNYEEFTIEELKDVFIQIDDLHYSQRAFTIFEHFALRLKVDLIELQLEDIIKNPTESYGIETKWEAEYGLNVSYTRDAITVRDKLARLKKLVQTS